MFSMALFSQFRKELIDSVGDSLMTTAKTAAANEISPKLLTKNAEIIKRLGTEHYRVFNRNGEVIIASLNGRDQWPLNKVLMGAAFKGMPAYENVKYRGEDYRVLYFPVNEENILFVWESLEAGEKDIARLERLFMVFLPFVLLVTTLISWLLAGKLLAPFVTMRSLAEQIRQGKLKERITLGFKGREIEDLVTIFNDMLDGIQQSMEAQKSFSSDVSHEIRSPLTSLRGSIEVALRKKRTPEEYEEVLKNNLSDIVRLSRITDNLLFLARADNKILELRRQWLDIGHLVERVVEQLKYKALAAGVSIEGTYGENIEISGDVELLEQAFTNLLDNAIKYSRRGGMITVRAEEEEGHITATISDTGVGIPEADIPHIFDRFYRVNKAHSRKLGGTGLGLAITQWIINAHSGKMSVKSIEGSGTDFSVVLPKKPA
jgi:heavy metal sensor kinase